jgi:hypothetical protein
MAVVLLEKDTSAKEGQDGSRRDRG